MSKSGTKITRTEELATVSSQVRTRRLDAIPLVDELIFGDFEWLDMTNFAQEAMRNRLVVDAFEWHVERCAAYGEFARRRGFASSTDVTGSLSRIPQLPVSVFKHQEVVSVASAEIVGSFTSSGTSGVHSIVHRDDTTLHRLCGAMRPENPLIADIVGGMSDDSSLVLNLGPDREEAGHVWFAFVMGLLEQAAPMRYYLSGEQFRLADAARDLISALEDYAHVLLIGAPYLVASLAEYIETCGLTVHGENRLAVFTGGGWKRRQSEAMSRDIFRTSMVDAFGLSSEAQVRDVFNQVEINSLFVECPSHHKHIPPWVHAFARDLESFNPLPAGKPGLLSYSDASALSYPCFVISDDIGIVESGVCDCGREGLRLKPLRRLRTSTHQGCGATLAAVSFADRSGR